MKKGKWSGLMVALAVIIALMVPQVSSAQTVEKIREQMAEINLMLEAMGMNVRLEKVEYYTAENEAGQTVYWIYRTKQLPDHWVPGDYRRGGHMDIKWYSDQVDGAANPLTLTQTQDAVDMAMNTWDSVKCSNIPLTKMTMAGDLGLVQWLKGFGGSPFWLQDITHGGWMPGNFWPSPGILGMTYTFIYIYPDGSPTDIDNNGKLDVAFREIYYNNSFTWGINPTYPTIDVQTVVMHETGHGLSQAHFGFHFKTDKNGKLHFAPRALMNPSYSGIIQKIKGTDNGGHCSIWGGWPYH